MSPAFHAKPRDPFSGHLFCNILVFLLICMYGCCIYTKECADEAHGLSYWCELQILVNNMYIHPVIIADQV